ncbi:hypothetical protein [Methanocaldococcus sp.]
MKKLFYLFLLILIFPLANAFTVYVNTSTVDYNNSKILLENLFNSRDIIYDNNSVEIRFKNIYYVPAKSELDFKNLHIKVESGKIKDVFYYLPIENKLILEDKVYHLYKKEDEKIIYIGDPIKINVNESSSYSFSYDNYKIKVVLLSLDRSSVILNITNNNYKKEIKIFKNKPYLVDNRFYINYIDYINKEFIFNITPVLVCEKGKDFPLDKKFLVYRIKDDNIVLKYKDKFNGSIILLNKSYVIKQIKNNIFKIFESYTKKYNLTSYKNIDNNLYILNKKVCYKDEVIKNNKTIYLGEVNAGMGLNLDDNIILIGGPVVNPYVRKLINLGLIPNISNNYPGGDRGLILKIKNPYKRNYYIYILAGSNRVGTKKAIEYFITKYNNENKVLIN